MSSFVELDTIDKNINIEQVCCYTDIPNYMRVIMSSNEMIIITYQNDIDILKAELGEFLELTLINEHINTSHIATARFINGGNAIEIILSSNTLFLITDPTDISNLTPHITPD